MVMENFTLKILSFMRESSKTVCMMDGELLPTIQVNSGKENMTVMG